ncbi:carbon-nitrogen hydrolase family protein [Piscinibacter sakaiensis]|uniref:Putative amidohydrolase n=1 Tax=Piscinibacter sakaiensis TaxID=1547922 RepID=A0A0K8P558_PISS1|nr:carbon-nitrogen hydrolase family protein [Piscinibacter sakaiensis]GAP37777.1 putative amidohydrolase [Piscinibacter sakaiensis]
MKIAALQMVATPRVADNLAAARRLMEAAAADGARLVALPEYFCLMGLRDGDKLAVAEAPGRGPIQEALADAARSLGLWVIGGTLPITCPLAEGEPPRVFNRSLLFAPDGQAVAAYDKMHLFRFRQGDEHYDESRVLRAGDTPVAATLPGLALAPGRDLRVALSVCYDLRFPELYRALGPAGGQPPLDLIAVPAAFTVPTGRAHWELLLRARAVENQCYLIAPAQGGLHESGRRTWGHSLVVDPWGEVLAVRPEGEGVVLAELDAARLADVRARLPALEHVRPIRHAPRD